MAKTSWLSLLTNGPNSVPYAAFELKEAANSGGLGRSSLIDEEIDAAWSQSIASIAAVTLIHAKLVASSEQERVTEIIAEEIRVRLLAGDRPDRENWKYKSN